MDILPARAIQPTDDIARLAAERAEHGVTQAVLAAMDAGVKGIDLPTLARMIEYNRFSQVWRHLAIERIGASLRPALNRLAVVHDQVAVRATSHIPLDLTKAKPSTLVTPAVIHLTYDPLDRATVQAQNETNDTIQSEIEDTANATAEQILADGLRSRLSADQIARAIRDTMGLSEREALAVQNYRAALQGGGSAALQRALRDRRFDGTVRRGDLTVEQIDRMVQRYAERYRMFRAQRRARTETLRAANQGRTAAWRQYAARTGLSGSDVRRFWLTAGDELVCPVCRAIPGLNPNGVSLDEPYQTPIGPIMAPPDPHPLCRCTEQFRAPERPVDTIGSANSVGLRVELDYGT